MELFLLGPVRAQVDGRPVSLGVRQQRLVLGVLALEANRLITVERLTDLCWPEDPPPTARQIVRSQISRLRSTLAMAEADDTMAIRGDGRPGYLLACDPESIDAVRFTLLLERARATRDDQARLDLIDRAVGLWRGPALADAAPQPTRAVLCAHLDQAYVDAREERLEVLLRLGRHHEVIAEAAHLAAEHPLRHRTTVHLVLALYRAGRTAEALGAYRHAKQRLADELGLDPPAELAELETAILRAAPELDHSPASVGNPRPAAAARPAQLPVDVATFTGRSGELDALCHLAAGERDGPRPTAVVITAIDGMAGIGKTTLAVHAAHRLAARYPDGQIFLDLHGHTRDVAPMDPGDALERMLRTLGMAGDQIPPTLQDRASAWRTRVAARRMLVVLDNAADETQVIPLLPAAPRCLVLITSRRRLIGLDHARPFTLDLLPLPDAVTLFTRIAGPHRVAGQPEHLVTGIVERCGRLPLAITIAAARLRARPAWNLRHLAERLDAHRNRLTEFAAGHQSIAAALDLSYRHLEPEQQRLYRLLSLPPGTDVDTGAAAALFDTTADHADHLLQALLDAHLLDQHTPGRYQFHDLTRAHTHLTATRYETEADRRSALDRLHRHYAHAATLAMDAAYPAERHQRPRTEPATTPAPRVDSAQRAVAWLDGEMHNLLATAHAAAAGRPDHLLHQSATLTQHLRARGHYSHMEALHLQALEVARDIGDRPGELLSLNTLGHVHWVRGRNDQALDTYDTALAVARDIGHHAGELDALLGLGYAHQLQGRYEQAILAYEEAHQITREHGNAVAEWIIAFCLGQIHNVQARPDEALGHYMRALRIAKRIGGHLGDPETLTCLAQIHQLQGRPEQADDFFSQALRSLRFTGRTIGEPNALNALGRIHLLQGRHREALEYYTMALESARQSGSRASEIRALTGLGYVQPLLGNHEEAAGHLTQALRYSEEIASPYRAVKAHHGLGRVYRATGRHDRALTHHSAALAVATELGHPTDQAIAHAGLGRAHHALGDTARAQRHWRTALDILITLGVDHTEVPDVGTGTLRAWIEESRRDPGTE